ncbi:MAG: single-stranded-DNA-specific exonuclease RecJ [Chloroflexota bacterium]
MIRGAWKLLPPAPSDALASDDLPPLIRQILYNRGVRDIVQARAFLAGDSSIDGDPFTLPDMEHAVSRIFRALLSSEKIAVYGDFDVDGITATVVLIEGLSLLGASVVPYIPHRINEGYGLHANGLYKLQQAGVSLVITCDSGITAIDEIRHAQKIGLDVIVTDHHLPLSSLPKACAVINPKRKDSQYPFSDLAGVGVAYKLLEALVWGTLRRDDVGRLLDLVALGTIADMSPLLGENRYLVRRGLEVLRSGRRPGICEMARRAGLELDDITAEKISWVLGPRLNSAGRLDEAIPSYELLITSDATEAGRLADKLEQSNAERQQLTRSVLASARAVIQETKAGAPVLVAVGEEYPPGVVGLVAGRLVEEFYRPVCIIKKGANICRGSARSIPEFNLMGALEQCADLLIEFGGHSQAAGFTVPEHKLSEFESRICELATKQLEGLDLRPHITIDVEVPLSSLNRGVYNTIQRLAPFGTGNPVPVLLSCRVKLIESRRIGGDSEHLRLKLRDKSAVWQAVGFGLGGLESELGPYVDVVYTLEVDHWRNEETLRLNLLDVAQSQ